MSSPLALHLIDYTSWLCSLLLVAWYAAVSSRSHRASRALSTLATGSLALALATIAAILGGLQTSLPTSVVLANPWLPLVAAAGGLGVVRVFNDLGTLLRTPRRLAPSRAARSLELVQPDTQPPNLAHEPPVALPAPSGPVWRPEISPERESAPREPTPVG